MRSIRIRILATCVIVLAAGVGGWQLLPSRGEEPRVITVGTTDDVSGLDPAGSYDAGSWSLYSNLYQSLLTFEPRSAVPVPDAASGCRFLGEKLRTYQCELRSGLTFSNGHALTAQDVKYSFDRMRTVDVGDASSPKPLFESLASVKVTGNRITFSLRTGDATFPFKMATGAGAIVDRSEYSANQLRTGDTVVASGPYVLKKYKAGVRARLEPNPSYQGAVKKTRTPIEIRYYKEAEQLNAAWKAKRIDVTHRKMPPEVLAELGPGDRDVRISESEGSEIRNLVFNLRESSPMSSRSVRQAAAWLIDRNKIASEVYHGTVEPLYSLIPQGVTGHSTPYFDAYPNPDRARAGQLLRNAGVETPVGITLGYSLGGATRPEAAELREQLQAGGLFKVRLAEKAEWQDFQEGYAAGAFDAFAIGWLPDFPDPDSFSQPLVGRGSSLSNGYESERIEELILATQEFSDRGRTARDFKELQETVAQDVPLVPLWQTKDFVLTDQDVRGGQSLSDGTGVWRLWELGWL
ncbi:ABC transporter substrate-binding protein [Streptomyces sp. 21So2-11]|uniref:ABC transporter substrate-binding protein n=1 Tax=Streptomyces sp. 21So2-11 TaxID=3144408 RepID=UPI00321B1340